MTRESYRESLRYDDIARVALRHIVRRRFTSYYHGRLDVSMVAASGTPSFTLRMAYNWESGCFDLRLAPVGLAPQEGVDLAELDGRAPPAAEPGNRARFQAIVEHYTALMERLSDDDLSRLAETVTAPASSAGLETLRQAHSPWQSENMDLPSLCRLLEEQLDRRLLVQGFRAGEMVSNGVTMMTQFYFARHLICQAVFYGHLSVRFLVPGQNTGYHLHPRALVRLLRRANPPVHAGPDFGLSVEEIEARLRLDMALCDEHLADVLSGETSIRSLCEWAQEAYSAKVNPIIDAALAKAGIKLPHD